MSTLPTCVQCGGREFYVESGFYFCAECQIQSQDIREHVLAEVYQGGTQVRTTAVSKPSKRKSRSLPDVPELTSWEVLNFILKGWVDELLSLGVDRKVKIVALQLWVAYLRKLEVAFTSSVVQKKPRLGFTFRSRDAELMYGATDTQTKMLKKPFSSKSSAASSQASTSYSARISKKKKKELATVMYEEESAVSDTSRSNVTLDNLSTPSAGSVKSKMCYTTHAKKTWSKLFGSMENLSIPDQREVTFKHAINCERKSLRHLNILNLFALLRIAMIICKSPVQLSDMFRWSREGYLSLRDVERLIPPGYNVSKDIKALLVKSICSWENITKKVYHLSQYLNINNLTIDLLQIIKKLASELHLPEDIMEIIRKLYLMETPKSTLSSSVNYEGRAISFIIFILKVVFSLDGRTELINSQSAVLVNKSLECKSSLEKRLFVWTEWTELMELRDAVISQFHIPSRETWYPGAGLSVSTPAFLGQWSLAPKTQLVQRYKEVPFKVAQNLDRILDPLCSEGVHPPKPSLFPSSTLIEHAASFVQSDVRAKLESLVNCSTKCSLSLYFETDRLTEIAVENGCKVCYDLPVEINKIPIYRSVKVKPSSLQEMVTVYLSGDLTSSNSSCDEDPDDPDYMLRSKRKEKRKYKDRKSKKKNNFESSDDTYSSQGSMSEGIKKIVLPTQKGNIASKIDLTKTFSDDSKQWCDIPVIYLIHNDYWRLEGSFYRDSLTIDEFEEFAQNSFSPSFYWLLKRCSKLIDQSMRDVYRQFLIVEEIYVKYTTSFAHYRKRLINKW